MMSPIIISNNFVIYLQQIVLFYLFIFIGCHCYSGPDYCIKTVALIIANQFLSISQFPSPSDCLK